MIRPGVLFMFRRTPFRASRSNAAVFFLAKEVSHAQLTLSTPCFKHPKQPPRAVGFAVRDRNQREGQAILGGQPTNKMVYSVIQNVRAALKYRGGWKGLLTHMYTVSYR